MGIECPGGAPLRRNRKPRGRFLKLWSHGRRREDAQKRQRRRPRVPQGVQKEHFRGLLGTPGGSDRQSENSVPVQAGAQYSRYRGTQEPYIFDVFPAAVPNARPEGTLGGTFRDLRGLTRLQETTVHIGTHVMGGGDVKNRGADHPRGGQ